MSARKVSSVLRVFVRMNSWTSRTQEWFVCTASYRLSFHVSTDIFSRACLSIPQSPSTKPLQEHYPMCFSACACTFLLLRKYGVHRRHSATRYSQRVTLMLFSSPGHTGSKWFRILDWKIWSDIATRWESKRNHNTLSICPCRRPAARNLLGRPSSRLTCVAIVTA